MQVLEHSRSAERQTRVLCVLGRIRRSDPDVWVGIAELADWMGEVRSSVQYSLKGLVSRGLVCRRDRGYRGKCVFEYRGERGE